MPSPCASRTKRPTRPSPSRAARRQNVNLPPALSPAGLPGPHHRPGGRSSSHGQLLISRRPAEAQDPGHPRPWEGDLMDGPEQLRDRHPHGARQPVHHAAARAVHAPATGAHGLGLDHFEGGSWPGWHHHVTLVTAAHAFLTEQRLAPKVPGPASPSTKSSPPLQDLLRCWTGICTTCQQPLPSGYSRPRSRQTQRSPIRVRRGPLGLFSRGAVAWSVLLREFGRWEG
jgi:hypothetical protein